ncbi:zinc transporter [Klebsiella quasipneumoniae]|nr:zinc transporter [Klebsiella quasipneumoniae]
MDAIKGSELQIPDAIFAWVLDGQGGVKPLADNDIIDKEKPCWLHLNYTHSDSADWLAATPLLPNNVRDAPGRREHPTTGNADRRRGADHPALHQRQHR